MKQNHAFLIMAHSQKNLLKVLLSLLDHEESHIYLHIDDKAAFSPEEFASCIKRGKIKLVKQRDVRWGGASQIRCELALLEEAVKEEHAYYHLLSGVDLPILPIEKMFRFFEENAGKEFVNIQSEDFPEEFRQRVSRYWLFQEQERKSGIFYRLNRFAVLLQTKLGIDRTKGEQVRYYKGANWFSITDALARDLVASKKSIEKRYRFTRCCDEIFLQTHLMNSPFRENLFDPSCSDSMISYMRYVDWERGNPYTFRQEDVPALLSSGLVFARKFEEDVSKGAIESIQNALKQ